MRLFRLGGNFTEGLEPGGEFYGGRVRGKSHSATVHECDDDWECVKMLDPVGPAGVVVQATRGRQEQAREVCILVTGPSEGFGYLGDTHRLCGLHTELRTHGK